MIPHHQWNEAKTSNQAQQSTFWAYANDNTYNLVLHKWHLSTKLFLVPTNNHLSNLITCPCAMIVVVRCIFSLYFLSSSVFVPFPFLSFSLFYYLFHSGRLSAGGNRFTVRIILFCFHSIAHWMYCSLFHPGPSIVPAYEIGDQSAAASVHTPLV